MCMNIYSVASLSRWLNFYIVFLVYDVFNL